MIRCYQPKGKFSRVYVVGEIDREALWAAIREQEYEHLLPSYWETEEDEERDRNAWLKDFDDPTCWKDIGPVAVDSHY